MIRSKSGSTSILLLLILGFSAVACQDEDNVQTGDFEVTIENVGDTFPIFKSGAFTNPVGSSSAGPITPGGAYEFEFTAPMGSHLSLTTMFVQSNDWFYATDSDGIALYNSDGSKVTGDVTSQIGLYDAGTEEDQEPGVGDNQAPRQSGPDTGPADDDNSVRAVENMNLPSNEELIRVTLTSTSGYGFRVRIENVSESMTIMTSQGGVPGVLSPGTWLVHSPGEMNLLYTIGQPDYGNGLGVIAEDGDPGLLAGNLADQTGINVPLSPGAYAVYSGENPIFMANSATPGNGLEMVAEDGMPGMLATALASLSNVSDAGAFDTPSGAGSPAPIFPGDRYTFTLSAEEGERLSFATMHIQSNDLFYGPMAEGIDLFSNGSPISGDITSEVQLWDAGTEFNQEPGVGSDQAPRQSAANTGAPDSNDNVRLVSDGYVYGAVTDHIRVSIRMIN